MAPPFVVCKSVSVTGTAGSANLIASASGQSIRIWQLVISGTAADSTVAITYTVGGTQTTVALPLGAAGSLIVPATTVPWAAADTGTGITQVAAATTKIVAYYTEGIGG